METLFNDSEIGERMERSAAISGCLQYRWFLWRWWNKELPSVLFVMLNPSTADNRFDHATVRRCIAFAKSWKFGSLTIVNLFAYRATDPKELRRKQKEGVDIIGFANDEAIKAAASEHEKIIVAWGALDEAYRERAVQVLEMLKGKDVCCLSVTNEGFPGHPLYLPSASLPFSYPPKEED